MDPMLLLIGLLTMAAVAIAVTAGYGQVARRREAINARVGAGDSVADPALGSPLREEPGRRLFLVKILPLSREAEERTRRELEQAGWPIRVREYLALRLIGGISGVLCGVLLAFLLHLPMWMAIIAAIGLGFVGWLIPRMMLTHKRQRRLEQIEKQLAEAVTAMAKALRAGAGFLQALAHVAKETPAPLGPEFRRALRDLELGAEASETLRALSDRINSQDLDIVVTAIIIQKTVGGNLSEILMTVANTIRERAKITAEVQTLTARQRLTANFVAALPVLAALAFILLRPEIGRLLIQTTAGQVSLLLGLILELFGLWLIRRLAIIQV